jgi:lauroyl/myristoyl acyltransferase
VARSGDRRGDVEALTRPMGERLEQEIAVAPEEWFAAFQPVWPDLPR